jgi:histidine ammonia-lyase
MRLTDENSNAHTLPAFLTEHGGLNSGFMIVQYTAAALCTENKILAHPACVDTIPTSANVEDHVSMGATGALKLRQVADNLANILAIELLCAAQGIDFRKRRGYEKSRLGKRTKPVYDAIRNQVPFIEHDEYLKNYIDNVRGIVDRFENG